MKHLRKFNESNEELSFDKVVKMEKLEHIAKGLLHLCLGEYGNTFINKEEMKIGVCLGDVNPFGDFDELEDWIRWECIDGDHEFIKSFDIEIDCEWQPGQGGFDVEPTQNGKWLTFDGKEWK